MDINSIVKEVHQIAIDKGWWSQERKLPELLMLCVSELSEALEEYRNHQVAVYMKDGKPEGIAIELVDCIIRIMDIFGENDWDLEEFLKLKMEYNKNRSYRHGGKKI